MHKIIVIPGAAKTVFDLINDPAETTDIASTMPVADFDALVLLDSNVRESFGVGAVRSTWAPSLSPTNKPVVVTRRPSLLPTALPSARPTRKPTQRPTKRPTNAATKSPTSHAPTSAPSAVPSVAPSVATTIVLTSKPTRRPSSKKPTSHAPSESPSSVPSVAPTQSATDVPSRANRERLPSQLPTTAPTPGTTASPESTPAPSKRVPPPTTMPPSRDVQRPVSSSPSSPSAAPSQAPTTQPPVPDSAGASAWGSIPPLLPCSTTSDCNSGALVCFVPAQLPWLRASDASATAPGLCGCSRALALVNAGVACEKTGALYVEALSLVALMLTAVWAMVRWARARAQWPQLPWWATSCHVHWGTGAVPALLFLAFMLDFSCIVGGVALDQGQCTSQPFAQGLRAVAVLALAQACANVWLLLLYKHERRPLTPAVLGIGTGVASGLWASSSAHAVAGQCITLVACWLCAAALAHAAWASSPAPLLKHGLVLCSAVLAGTGFVDAIAVAVIVGTTADQGEAFEPGDWQRPGHFLTLVAYGLLVAGAVVLVHVVVALPPCKETFAQWVLPNQTQPSSSSPSKPPTTLPASPTRPRNGNGNGGGGARADRVHADNLRFVFDDEFAEDV